MGRKHRIIVTDIYENEDTAVRAEKLYELLINLIRDSEYWKLIKC